MRKTARERNAKALERRNDNRSGFVTNILQEIRRKSPTLLEIGNRDQARHPKIVKIGCDAILKFILVACVTGAGGQLDCVGNLITAFTIDGV